jgi:hypothetical protein
MTLSATRVDVAELTQDQALRLLGRWAGQSPESLPEVARVLCTRVDNLALAVAMAGAMAAAGRRFADILELIDAGLDRVHADLDPEYAYRTLYAAIEAGITVLPSDAQHRYEELAVFSGRGPFPRQAACVLWGSHLPEAQAGDLLAELTGRSLLTPAGEGWFAAHDLRADNQTVRLWDLATGAQAAQLDGHPQAALLAVSMSPDGQRAVTGARDSVVRVWDLHAMAQVAQLTGHPGRVGSVAVSHDGRRAVTGGQDGIVRVWDLIAMAQAGHLAGHTGWVVSAAMSPAVASSAAGVPLWACGPAGCGRGVQAVVVRI